ncbi:MAG: hypothetical protein ACNI3C_09500 [Candidatus Marinarcus sp.]|uniref:hypothetical protein n=1 Tax=Candidatus Marinarcus sp. TaxID=3100987 RepID=UPI003AFFC03A
MKKIAIFLFVFFMVNLCHANEMQKFGKQMSYFYLNSTEKNYIEFQKRASSFEQQLKSSKRHTDTIVALMIARISEKYNWSIQDTFLKKQALEILQGKSRLAKFINDDNAVNPTKLDMWWASYFATGDEKYLHKILLYAGEELPGKDNVSKLLIIGAATWSFKSNCKQHKSVRDFALKMSNDSSLSMKKRAYLLKVVEFADKAHS